MKELGFKQESLFYYIPTSSSLWLSPMIGVEKDEKCVSAYTVAELGEMLPDNCKSYKGGKYFYWECRLIHKTGYQSVSGASTEADARAKMLIYLKENNLI